MTRFSRPVLAAALCAALAPAIGRAQSDETNPYYYVDGASGQGMVATASLNTAVLGGPACDAPSCGAGACGGNSCCDSCCGRRGFCWPCGCKLEDLGEACKLWKPCCEDSPWSAGGWLAQGFTWNPYSPNDRFNGPMTWMDRSNEYQMNELYGYMARTPNTEECCFDWGARVDALYGTNYRWNTSTGFESNWGNGSFYGLAVPQAYVEAAYSKLSVKFGRYFSPVGYYVIGTSNNFFSVLPYTFQYGEPFTHTGMLATYKLSDELTVSGGVTHGWDNSDNTGNPHAGGLATASWTIDEERALTYVGVFGPEPNFSGVNASNGPAPANGVGFTSRYLQTLVFTRKFSDDVMGVLQSDYGVQADANVPGDIAKWYGINGYLYWNMTCRCQWGMNVEWFRDQGGFRVGGVLPSFGSPNARGIPYTPVPIARIGYDGSFYRFMFGPKYYFTPNVYGRAAFAADWYVGKNNNAGNLRPFDDGQRDHQQVVAFDLIATF